MDRYNGNECFYDGCIGWEWLLLSVFGLVVMVQLFYHWYFFSRIAFFRRGQEDLRAAAPSVSVIICARNEYINLRKNLPLVLQQKYGDFEVVVVDDCSTDGTHGLLKDFQHEYGHLKVVSLTSTVSFMKGKKLPLSVGIKSARHELLLLTDADCRPSGPFWVRDMTRHQQEEGVDIVLGYGPYEARPGLLNRLIRLDTLLVALQYLSLALAGHPYMGVGRNLSYKRRLFYLARGFTSHYHMVSGDDDIFINQVAGKSNTTIEISHGAQMVSEPESRFSDWYRQKRRHLTSGRMYRKKHRWLLGVFLTSQWLFYPLFVLIVIVSGVSPAGQAGLALFLVRMLSHYLIIRGAANTLDERKICLFSLAGDGLLALLSPLFALSSLFSPHTKWR